MKHYRMWTDEEIALLREHYPRGGTKRVQQFMARSADSISAKAHNLGIGIAGRQRNAEPQPSSEWIDTAIRRSYERGGARVKPLARIVDRSVSWVRHRAQALGVSRTKSTVSYSPWLAEEDALLADCLERNMTITAIHYLFHKRRFQRSLQSIGVRINLLGLRWQKAEWTAQEVAKALGCSWNTVMKWINTQKLPAQQKRGPSVAHLPPAERKMYWHIKPAHLRQFMLDYPREWDHRKMHQEMLLDLLVGDQYGLNKGGLGISQAQGLAG